MRVFYIKLIKKKSFSDCFIIRDSINYTGCKTVCNYLNYKNDYNQYKQECKCCKETRINYWYYSKL